MQVSDIRLFIVIGRTGHSLIACKAMPFAALEEVREIFVFSETEGFVLPKSSYITIPSWIRKIRPVFLANSMRFLYEPLQLLYYTLKLKPDIINGVYCLPKGLNSLIIAKLTGTKCFISVIGSRLEIETELPFRKIWERLNLWLLAKCDAIAIKGKTDRDYLISKKIDHLKMFPLNGSIDVGKFHYTNEKRIVDILFVGTFYELKGPDRFIEIVQKLIPSFPGLKVLMVGNGKMWKKISNMVTDLKLEQTIRLEGFRKETVTYFQKSKILVMPSRSESLSTAMLEAMACGCVPVISDVGNVKEAAFHNINARLICNYMDTDSYVSNISDLLHNEEIRTEFALNGHKHVEKFYSVRSQSEIAKGIIKYLENL